MGEDVARRAVEVDLGEQIALAARAVRTRDDVVAVVSHDLKNPLNVIQLATRFVRAQIVGGEDPLATLDRIDRAAHRMGVLITDLLDLAKIEAGRFHVMPTPCAARALVADAITLQKPIAAERGVRLESAEVEDVSILVDQDRMFQVLANLLSNAIKFTPKEGQVSISSRTAGGFTRFMVHDDGPGMAPYVVDRVFDRYWQAPTSAVRQGSGLGLYIAKGLIEAHGGRIWAESVAGAGSTFFFTVPSCSDDDETPRDTP